MLLVPFDISGSALRITINNSIFWEKRVKSKGAGKIRNISLLVGSKLGFVISIPILHKIKKFSYTFFSVFMNSLSAFKVKGFKGLEAVCETASQHGVFLVLTRLIRNVRSKFSNTRCWFG